MIFEQGSSNVTIAMRTTVHIAPAAAAVKGHPGCVHPSSIGLFEAARTAHDLIAAFLRAALPI
jgi:hypothetical protein